MVAAVSDDIFAAGLYPIDQAARLSRLSPRVLRRWLDGDESNQPAMRRRMPKNDADVLSFLDLVQALAIRALRKNGVLSLQKVRETIVEADRLGFPYPFARKHETYHFDDDVVICLADGTVIGVTGKYKRQHLIKPIVEVYLDDLTYHLPLGLASRYTPLKDETGREIVIDPTIRYGAPTVLPCRYTVGSLISAVDSEGSIVAAADAYGVEEADVKFALRYDDMLSESVA